MLRFSVPMALYPSIGPFCWPVSFLRAFLCSAVRVELEERRNKERGGVGGRERGTDCSGTDEHRPLKVPN